MSLGLTGVLALTLLGGFCVKEREMDDVFDVLAEDHEDVRQTLAELEKGPTAATGACEDRLMLRKMMTDELIVEQFKHGEAELACLWPAVRQYVAGGDELADRGICDELEIFEIMPWLGRRDPADRDFEILLAQYTRATRAHFDFEERYVWPRLGSVLPPRLAAELGHKVQLGKQATPVPPLPSTWLSPGENARYGSFG
jgi:hypothetical protein